MNKEECVVGRQVSFVRTISKGSGFEMKTLDGEVMAINGPDALVRHRNGRGNWVKIEALSPVGTLRPRASRASSAMR